MFIQFINNLTPVSVLPLLIFSFIKLYGIGALLLGGLISGTGIMAYYFSFLTEKYGEIKKNIRLQKSLFGKMEIKSGEEIEQLNYIENTVKSIDDNLSYVKNIKNIFNHDTSFFSDFLKNNLNWIIEEINNSKYKKYIEPVSSCYNMSIMNDTNNTKQIDKMDPTKMFEDLNNLFEELNKDMKNFPKDGLPMNNMIDRDIEKFVKTFGENTNTNNNKKKNKKKKNKK